MNDYKFINVWSFIFICLIKMNICLLHSRFVNAVPTVKEKGLFKIVLKIDDRLPEDKTGNLTYTAGGKTVYEAISNLPIDYTGIKTKGVITLSKGKKNIEKFFYMKQLRMMLANHLRRQGWAKQLEDLLRYEA